MQVCCLIEADAGCYPPVPLIADATLPTPVVTISEPLRETAAVGVNLTLTVQLAPAASEDGQVVETKLKSVPLTDAAVGTVMLRAAAPVLLRVAASVELAPMATVPNARLGLIVAPASAATCQLRGSHGRPSCVATSLATTEWPVAVQCLSRNR